MMTVKEIIANFLRKEGFDGLFHPGDCACELDDLMACAAHMEEAAMNFMGIASLGFKNHVQMNAESMIFILDLAMIKIALCHRTAPTRPGNLHKTRKDI